MAGNFYNSAYPYNNPYLQGNNNYYSQQQMPYMPPNMGQMAQMQGVQNANPIQAQQPIQNTQTGLNRSDIIPMMYATYAEATAYRVEPMQRIMFSITDKPLFMLKQADINGRTMVEEYPITPKQPTKTPNEADFSEFIKRNELNDYVTEERLKSEIKSIVNDFTKQLEEIKKIVSEGVNKNV